MFGNLTTWLLAGMFGMAPLATLPDTDDPVLFTVNGKEVRVSEFKYIYNKNNGEKANYSKASLEEYLKLYIDFKLLIAKGTEIGLDKNPAIVSEQMQYKRQLASTYLTDREITEKLVREAYEWSKEDRSISHILVAVKEGASEQELREAYERAQTVKKQTTAANFADMARQYSDDQYSKNKGGALGFYTALQLPYELEKAMYGTAKGSISEIVRTKYGYHIVKVDEVRPAYGQMQVAHIIVRATPGDEASSKVAKERIDSIYKAAQSSGTSFEELAARHSEDNETKNKGGMLGWISINRYAKAFEDAAFALKKDGDLSAPFQTSSGWHIVKRIKGVTAQGYPEAKTELMNRIKKNERFELAQAALVERIKKESDFKLNEANVKKLLDSLDASKTFLTYNWQPTPTQRTDQTELFSIGNFKGTVADFVLEAQRNPADRVNAEPRTLQAGLDRILQRVVTQRCLSYEETRLETKYPDFKALLREYEEGILLFEVKKQLVWDKASADKEGLEAFYKANSNKYKWSERARVTLYTVNSNDEKLLKKIRSTAQKKDPEAVKALFNKDKPVVQTVSNVFEKGKNPEVDALGWKKGAMSASVTKDGITTFSKIEEITPPTVKTLDEARGFVVADYQDHLEKQLIEELRKNYKVEVKQDVFNGLIK